MTVKEKLDIENNRDESTKNRIYFFKEGEFWGAYEKSAMMAVFFDNGLDEKQRLNANRKKTNECGEYVSCGLKLSSFKKYFPGTSISDEITDNMFCFDYVGSRDFSDFETWKNGVRMHGQDKKTKTTPQAPSSKIGIMSVVSDILKYDANSNSDSDNTLFLNKIKNDILKIMF